MSGNVRSPDRRLASVSPDRFDEVGLLGAALGAGAARTKAPRPATASNSSTLGNGSLVGWMRGLG
jgi:hypothetical protein